MSQSKDLCIIRKSYPDPVPNGSIVIARMNVDDLDWKDKKQVNAAFRRLIVHIEEQLPDFLARLTDEPIAPTIS